MRSVAFENITQKFGFNREIPNIFCEELNSLFPKSFHESFCPIQFFTPDLQILVNGSHFSIFLEVLSRHFNINLSCCEMIFGRIKSGPQLTKIFTPGTSYARSFS